jgi:hypothetical protein
MVKRIRKLLGDIFKVPLSNGKVGYVQFIAIDETMLGAHVIRAFQTRYDADDTPDLQSYVAAAYVQFFAHVFLDSALKFFAWEKVGNAPYPEHIDVLFRDSGDYGTPEIKTSHDWYVWRINEPQRAVGSLTPEYQNAEIGVVIAPQNIAGRMLTGSYPMVYPAY